MMRVHKHLVEESFPNCSSLARAIEVSTGRVLAIARRTGTGADLLERASAVTALEEATLEVAAILIPEILNHWSP